MAWAAWYLELAGDPGLASTAAPTEEELLVLYAGRGIDDDVVSRLIQAAGTWGPARNPYWDR